MGRGKSGVRPRGKSIQIDFYYRGQRCIETIRLTPNTRNLNFARRKRDSILYEIETGTFCYSKHFPESKKLGRIGLRNIPTVGVQLEKWLNGKFRHCEYSTYKDYNSAINYHLKPSFGEILLNELTTADIKEWVSRLGISNKRINNILIPLRGMLGDAYADELIDRNPMDRIKNLTHRPKEPEPFTPDEVATIVTNSGGQNRNLIQFAFWTGLRTSELIALEWSDIDWESGVARVRRAVVLKKTKHTKSKSGDRSVKLLPPAIEALQSQKVFTALQRDRVFFNPMTDKPWTGDQQIRRIAWRPTLLRAGVAYRPQYQTRHTYASLMLSAGENPMWVAQQMGHRDWGMIRRVYGRWIPEVDTTGGDKIMAIWSRIGNKEQVND